MEVILVQTQNQIGGETKKVVMRRVRVIWMLRQLVSPIIAEVVLILAAFSSCIFMVSLQDIMANMLSLSFQSLFGFVVAAVWHTEFVVQILLIVMLAALFFFIKDSSKSALQTMQTIRFSRKATASAS